MTIRNRVQRLEQTHSHGTVIYISAPFKGKDDGEPVIRSAYVDGNLHERKPGEDQSAFTRRVNPTRQRSVLLESDVDQL